MTDITRILSAAEQRLGRETLALAAESRARSDAEEAIELAGRQAALNRVQRDLTLRNLYVAQIGLAHQDWKTGNLSRMKGMLDTHLPRPDLPDLRGWEWYYLSSLARSQENAFEPQLGRIDQVAWSPDERYLAIGGERGTIIYEPISQQIVRSFPRHWRAVWSPDGTRLATIAGEQATERIHLWNLEDWQEIRTLPGWPGVRPPMPHFVRIRPLVWRADSRGLAWAIGDHFSYWTEDLDEPTPMRPPPQRILGLPAMAWAPDGRMLLLGTEFPARVLFWDIAANQVVREVEVFNRGTTQIPLSPDGKRLAAGTIGGDIVVLNSDSGEVVHEFTAHNGHVGACVWSPDGKRLASGGEDNLIRVWDAQTGRPLQQFSGHRAMVQSLAWSQDDRLVSGAHDGTIRFWNPDENRDCVKVPGHGAAAWSPDGQRIVTNNPDDGDEPIPPFIIDVRTGQTVRRLESPSVGSMHAVAWSPNGKLIAGAGWDAGAFVWDAESGRLLHALPRVHAHETRGVAWSPDNRYFATCGMDRLVKIWDTSSGKLLHTFDDHPKAWALGSVAWSPDGRWFASADWQRDIKIRSTDTWQIEWDIDQQYARIGAGAGGDHTIAWSPDSERLAAVNASGEVVVWNLLAKGKCERLWAAEVHTSVIRSIAWSPDGSRIASGSEDRTAKILDAATGRELLTLGGHIQMVKSVSWSPDGRRLASAADHLHIWNADVAYETLLTGGGKSEARGEPQADDR